jgi:uncharacterized protein (DUF1778 family)
VLRSAADVIHKSLTAFILDRAVLAAKQTLLVSACLSWSLGRLGACLR